MTHSPSDPVATLSPRNKPQIGLFATLFIISGACGLIYEVVWSQLMIRVMGGTTFAITTVLVAFMGGLGFGSYIGGRLAARVRQPQRLYGVFEIAIGIYALILPYLLDAAIPLYRAVYPIAAPHLFSLTLMRFVISGLILAVPTVLMGATLPLLIEHSVRGGRGVGRSAGWMFSTNTFGAVLGAAFAGYFLVPFYGLSATIWLAAGLNVAVGLVAIFVAGSSTRENNWEAPDESMRLAVMDDNEAWRLRRPSSSIITLWVFGGSGAAAMIYQVAWTRVLVPHLGPHTYSFTCVLCAFILGLALGGIVATRLADRVRNPLFLLGWIETLVAVGGAVVAVLLDVFPVAARRIAGTYYTDPAWMLVAQFVAVGVLLLIPTFALGMIYPVAVRIVAGGADHAGPSAGRAYAANTIGAIAGSFAAGFIMIPTESIGVHGAMLIGVAIHATCGLIMLFYSAIEGVKKLPALPVALCVCAIPAWWYVPDLQVVEFAQASYMVRDPNVQAQEYQIEYYREGVDATVAVAVRDGFKSLMINNKADGSSSIVDSTTQLLAGHLPMLMSDHPRDVLVVGWGTGMTVGAVSLHHGVEHIDAVEISDAVIDANREFADVNYNVRNDPRLTLIQQDGRNHLLLTDKKYDVIVSEPSNPWVAGMASLFTRQYYESCRDHLTDDGVFLAWMHSYSVNVAEFRSILRTVATVMPNVTLWGYRGDFMMICSRNPQRMSLATWLERVNQNHVNRDLARIGYDRPEHILAMYIGDRDFILDWTDGSPLHQDDHPRAQYSGVFAMLDPGFAEAQISAPLARLAGQPFNVLIPDEDDAKQRRLIGNVAKVREARQMLREATIARKKGDHVRELELLWSAYQRWPYDRSIWRELRLAHTTVALSGQADTPASRELLEQVADNLPPPTTQVVDPVEPIHAVD